MVSTISCDQSTSYSRAENFEDLASNSEFTFVDFLPRCIEAKGFLTEPNYEDFGTLVCRVNCWLQKNRQWNITTCERVKFKISGELRERVDSEKMHYYAPHDKSAYYIRGLRLWLSERKNDFERVQEIGFLNVFPQQVGVKGTFRSPIYETLDEVLSRLNSTPESNPRPGRVITVETQVMKFSSNQGLDPDGSGWVEAGTHSLFEIGIFYEVMAGNFEEIGIKDFVPDRLSEGGCCSRPDYEPFSCVVNKASDWCRQQQGLRFCNVQCLEIGKKRGKDIDTQKMHFNDLKLDGFNVRILRVCYTKPPSNLNLQMDMPTSISQLTIKTFLPVTLKLSILSYEEETLSQTKARVAAWVRATGAQVVSAETATVGAMDFNQLRQGTDASIALDQVRTLSTFVIRLYLDGVYREPPPEMLPPVPDIDDQSCCIVL